MDYSLFDAIRAGFTKIVFIVREEILEQIMDENRRAGAPATDSDWVQAFRPRGS